MYIWQLFLLILYNTYVSSIAWSCIVKLFNVAIWLSRSWSSIFLKWISSWVHLSQLLDDVFIVMPLLCYFTFFFFLSFCVLLLYTRREREKKRIIKEREREKREREKERKRKKKVGLFFIFKYIHTPTFIYTHIYTHIYDLRG